MGQWIRYSKYTNRTSSGYRSKEEEKFAALMKENNIKFKYEDQQSKIDYVIQHTYTPDFILSNGIIIEYKGYLDTEDWRMHREIKKQFPSLDIRFVFQNSTNKINKQYKKNYGELMNWKNFKWTCCKTKDILYDIKRWSEE